ncbi:hypothetical protein JCM24511_01834 [Saitozyma sp. JCM 24511]|nr:hypothetical protein JCM24511_01834 [Saitozyma sp. JCM 24511]
MKAYQIKQLAHPSKIHSSTDVPIPTPQQGQVLVDVHAAGVNFFDILQAQGKYQYRVFGHAQGAYAEHVVADPRGLLPIPDNLSYEQAAVVFLTYTTSYEGLVGRGQAKPDDWVLVHAGAGGVGLAACQIAKVLGCKVIATVGSEEKRRICIDKAGVDAAIDYGKSDWQKEVMQITGGKGVDVVFDPVGLLIPSLKCVAWNARLVVVGFAGGTIEKVPANLLLLKQVSIVGLFWGATFGKDPPRAKQVLNEVMSLLSSGKVVPILYEPVYDGLESVTQALADLEGRKTWGKAVIRVRREQGERAKL